jgi:hypothetical protein
MHESVIVGMPTLDAKKISLKMLGPGRKPLLEPVIAQALDVALLLGA